MFTNTRIKVAFLLLAAASVVWANDGVQKFTSTQLSHWTYRKVRPRLTPIVNNKTWVKNPIDAFILKELESRAIKPARPANKITLLRRATLDLTGLPPTPEEVKAFLDDKSPDAFEKVVDRLLASPHYGEKWARHWLDLARYAESDGFRRDDTRPNIWRYRDYVIKSFNQDKPYDRFIKEQIAGDELWPDDPDALVATGFNRHYVDEIVSRNLKQRRQEILNSITDTVASVFLGSTYRCARCHDHKFDPITQKDYYRLQAFFSSVRAKDDFILASPKERAEYAEKLAVWEVKTKEIREQIAKLDENPIKQIYKENLSKYSSEVQEAVNTEPGKRDALQWAYFYRAKWLLDSNLGDNMETTFGRLTPEERKQMNALKEKLAAFDYIKPAPLPIGSGITDSWHTAPPTYLLAGGNYDQPIEEVQPGFLSIINADSPLITRPTNTNTTGRRSVLANWLADPVNPLVARVMVNRIWHYHFGKGLVGTPSDFGLMGETRTYTNRALLDYLASTFVKKDWSIKAIHRLIMLSNTYQQSSEYNYRAAQDDPKNNLFWRFPRRRLMGEDIRDSILFVSGQLSKEAGGPGIFPEIPKELEVRGGWKRNETEENKNKRSIYVFLRRNARLPFFQTFDMPDTEESCAKRNTTTTPLQALALLNDEVFLRSARAFADRVMALAGTDTKKQIETAFRLALSREPNPNEMAIALDFLQSQSRIIKTRIDKKKEVALPANSPIAIEPEQGGALVDFCHVLFNSNEFIYID